MAKQLGKIEKPSAESYKKGRKLFFMPLMFSMDEPDPKFKELLDKYWQQAREQIGNLEGKLSKVDKIFHELIFDTGDEAIKTMNEMDAGSKHIVNDYIKRNAKLQTIEDKDLMKEYIDWSQCMSVGLLSRRVFDQVNGSYLAAMENRNKQLADAIDNALDKDEIGLLIMREGYDIKFPPDIEMINIAPPALGELKQWLWKNGYSCEII